MQLSIRHSLIGPIIGDFILNAKLGLLSLYFLFPTQIGVVVINTVNPKSTDNAEDEDGKCLTATQHTENRAFKPLNGTDAFFRFFLVSLPSPTMQHYVAFFYHQSQSKWDDLLSFTIDSETGRMNACFDAGCLSVGT